MLPQERKEIYSGSEILRGVISHVNCTLDELLKERVDLLDYKAEKMTVGYLFVKGIYILIYFGMWIPKYWNGSWDCFLLLEEKLWIYEYIYVWQLIYGKTVDELV